MKNYVFVALIFLVSFSACRKEKKKPVKAVETAIKGTWFTTSEKQVYYDENNAIVAQVNMPVGYKYVLTTDMLLKKSTPAGAEEFKNSFSLSKADNKLYIAYNDKTSLQTFEVLSVTEKTMTWYQVTTNQAYGNGTKTAAKKTVTIDFHCPCPE